METIFEDLNSLPPVPHPLLTVIQGEQDELEATGQKVVNTLPWKQAVFDVLDSATERLACRSNRGRVFKAKQPSSLATAGAPLTMHGNDKHDERWEKLTRRRDHAVFVLICSFLMPFPQDCEGPACVSLCRICIVS